MVYAYDLWAQLPVKDLYDSQMMAAAISAAKDMYDRGQEQVKLFRKDYGDFISPFAKDMLAYREMVNGVRGLINESLANGIDLFKSPEGRALISRAVNSVDPGVYNQMRANAKIGYEYQSALQKLAAAGKFDKDMNDAWLLSLGMGPFDEFSTVDPNTRSTRAWGVSSPIEAISLRDLTSPGFAHRTAHELTKEQALRELGASYDPRKTYSGWVYEDLFDTAGKLVPGLRGDWRGQYFRNISARKALELNPNATEADIDRQYQADIAEANRQWLILPTGDIKDWLSLQSLNAQRERNNIMKQRLSLPKTKSGTGSSEKTSKDPISYYDTLYKDLVINSIKQNPDYMVKPSNNEFDLSFGNGMLAGFRTIAQEYFNPGVTKSQLYPITRLLPTEDNPSGLVESKFANQSITNSKDFLKKFFDGRQSDKYINRFSIRYPSAVFANSYNHGMSKVDVIYNDDDNTKPVEKLKGLNYVSFDVQSDIDLIYSKAEVNARSCGITGETLEKAIEQTKKIREYIKQFGNGRVFAKGVGKSSGLPNDKNQFCTYARIRLDGLNGSDVREISGDCCYMLPWQSVENIDGSDNVDLNLTDSFELLSKSWDNPAVKMFGVTTNNGVSDPTLPDPQSVSDYDLDEFLDFIGAE